MNPLGLEMLTMLGMPPADSVALAASLGCAEISTGLSGLPLSMFGLPDVFHPAWSLREDAALRREMKAAMADTGVRIGLAEGFRAAAAEDIRAYAADLDIFAELGALRLNAICMEDDLAMAADKLGVLAEMAIARGMVFTIEFFPSAGIDCLARALQVIGQIGNLANGGRVRLLIDTMHYLRTGGSAEELAALDPDLIGYVQLSDSAAGTPDDGYFQMAMFGRSVPGEGELPLGALVRALPPQVTVSLEVPNLEAMRAIGPAAHAARCVAAARALWGEARSD